MTTAGVKKLLHSFTGGSSDGETPVGDLVSLNGTLYGATSFGGTCRQGTVYSISTIGTEKLLHSFCGSDGWEPAAGLIDVNGMLYGTTTVGQSNGGAVYRISTSGAYKVLYGFRGAHNGAGPRTRLLNVNGTLYGTTPFGGTGCASNQGCGIVYSVSTTGNERVVYRFKGGSDGRVPWSALINMNGTLYGTTLYGGDSESCGTVYSVSTNGTEKVLYRFKGGTDGAEPEAGLLGRSSMLYGTAYYGGWAGDGILFAVGRNGVEQVLHSFAGGTDGAHPSADLTSLNGTLYGATDRGGIQSACSSGG